MHNRTCVLCTTRVEDVERSHDGGGRPAGERGRSAAERGPNGDRAAIARLPHVAIRSGGTPLYLVVLGLTGASQPRRVERSPQRRTTLETPPEAAPRPTTRTPGTSDAETARRTDSQLRVTPSRDRESAVPSVPSETRGGRERRRRNEMTQVREVVPVMDVKTTPKRSKAVATTKATRRPRDEDPQGARGRVRGQLHGRGDPRPDVRAPLDAAGRPPVRRDPVGIPHRRHLAARPARPSSSRRTSRSRRSGASSRPTSWSASTSAATSAPRSASTASSQLIDRVVNTIAAWAETQRYFATDEDLAAFKAELTHLIVHQKMAFNSPVWFNVGIEEKPQCSACFINSVQDNMGSIMDLAKTEAMLFKYGSGAGVNLSPIRSSKAKMTGGGIAIGPGQLHEGLRRVRRGHQVGRQDPPRGQDGDPGRGPPGRHRLHRVQGERGAEGLGPDRAGLRRRASPARPTAASSSRTPTTASA